MKFEKLNKDKIKITLSSADLQENNIDYHSFMSNSDKTQSLFLSVLDKAERDYGFSTDNYEIKVETLALDNGNFILTITRISDNDSPSTVLKPKKNFKVSRKVPKSISPNLVYRFKNFEDFCYFVEFLNFNYPVSKLKISKNSDLYIYNDTYYLLLLDINLKYDNLKGIFAAVTEFGSFTDISDSSIAKIYECGTPVMKNNALKSCAKYFLKAEKK